MNDDSGEEFNVSINPYLSADHDQINHLKGESRTHNLLLYLHGSLSALLFKINDYDFSEASNYAMLAGAMYFAGAAAVNILVSCSFSTEANQLEQKILREEQALRRGSQE